MATLLVELRAELTRAQQASLEADRVLNAAQPGTTEYGEARDRRQLAGLAVNKAQERLNAAVRAEVRTTKESLF
jgi:hypothetical protein